MARFHIFCLAWLLGTVSGVLAQSSYPDRPITLIVSAAAGSPPDMVARWLSDKLPPLLGQPIVIVNKVGAAGNLAMQNAAAAAPDGHTLVVAGQGPFALNPHMYALAGYDPLKDFAPITQIERGPLILAVNPALSVTSVPSLVALAKARPGELSYGSPGTGSPPHMVTELFLRSADIKVLRVPYPGTPAAMVDLIAGRIAFTFGAIPVQLPQIKAGTIRAIAVTSAKRSLLVPDLPTVAEQGLPGFEYNGWLGIAAPAATPRPIIYKLNQAIVSALQTNEAHAYFSSQGREAVGNSPEEFQAYVRHEFETWGHIIRAAGIRAE
jgi:tripartite-type tricarboxylate transporter receptor subunit TctC